MAYSRAAPPVAIAMCISILQIKRRGPRVQLQYYAATAASIASTNSFGAFLVMITFQ